MVKKPSCCFFARKEPVQSDSTKDLILEGARRHFSQKGFEGTSVRDICCEINVNVSAIKYHFGGKEGLYRECFKSYGESRLNTATQILTKANSREELKIRLKLFCEDFINQGLENMHITMLICREIETESPLISDIFQDTFLKVYSTLVEVLDDAKEKEIIKKDLDSSLAASFFMHSLTSTLRLDHVAKKYFGKTLTEPQHAEHFINTLITIFFDGATVQESL